ANLVVRRDPVALKRRVPLPDLVPTLERGHLNLGRLRFIEILFFLLGALLVVFIRVLPLEVRVFPRIDAPPVLFLDGRIESGFRLQLRRAALGDVYFETLVEHDPVTFEKLVLKPEVVGGQRRGYPPDDAIFKRVSGTKPGHRHVLLSEVGIDRRFTRDRSAQVLDGACLRGHHAPIRLAYADLFDVQFFVGGAVREDELAEALDAGVALYLYSDALFALSGPVFLEPVGSRHSLDDIRLLRIIGLFLFGRLRFGARRFLPLLRRLRGLGRDETIELKRRRSE